MQSLFFFLIALAILIVVHEFGHFWVARRCGVKVLKFSVGFGKPLWKKKGLDGTEYVLAAIPLGGFVKMLDEREGDVPAQDLDKAFNRKPLRSRVAIVAAGPIANLLFAVVAYWFIFVVGIPGVRSIIGEVTVDSPASYAQLIAGDEIKAVNDRITPTWLSVHKALLRLSETGGVAELTINSGGVEIERELEILKREFDSSRARSLLQDLGITPVSVELKPIIGAIVKGGAAEQAGIQIGDLLVSANGELINSWMGWVELIRANPDKLLNITVERSGKAIILSLTPIMTDENIGQIGAGVDSSHSKVPTELQAELRYGPIQAIGQAIFETWYFSISTIKSIAGMLTGTVSSKDIGGPISIAQYAGSSADRGLISFVSFLAMISISLGILNLLPIPILDGGHLAMYFVEWLRGTPLSEQIQLQGQKIGIVLLLMLMFLAFFNDLSRLFGE
ncbi:MAG: RIP metalloprotease RseP [Gammaproteobacteria bacterium]|nr:MAG: RIP metalloprotease RseP [Gammaproteobacteria bacterium]